MDDVFLTRLYSAFDTNPNKKGVDFKEFIEGLSVFMKGTPDEKLELSFKLYDIDHAGYITREGLERAMTQLHSVVATSGHDETHQIQELVRRIFDDLDVNGDGKLSLEEYKLNSMKEPMIIDFLGQFLSDQTDSGANSICSALSVPPSPRSVSTPPSPRFGHFAPPSPRMRDSLYGAPGHMFQSSSPAGSFRLSNSHSLLWLNGGYNGSGDLLGKVNEFEGLVAAEKEKEKTTTSEAGSESEHQLNGKDAASPIVTSKALDKRGPKSVTSDDEPASPTSSSGVDIVISHSADEDDKTQKNTTVEDSKELDTKNEAKTAINGANGTANKPSSNSEETAEGLGIKQQQQS
ncbi:hypothetical protein BGW41_001256 [Actinomortierella wolfii]|nr:hypothetical protein BGW41_001256 [Actinomortierella wolfii]